MIQIRTYLLKEYVKKYNATLQLYYYEKNGFIL